jgi:hypothetical protein
MDSDEVDESESFAGIYKWIMAGFGLGTALLLVIGFSFAIHWVDKHDRKAQTPQKIRQETHKRVKDPLLGAEKVRFEIPYLHGADPRSLRLMAELSKAKSGQLAGGFKVPAVYITANTRVETELSLKCETLCMASFEIPAKRILLPWFNGKKLHYPEREFKLESFGFHLLVRNSRLQGIGVQESALAAFDQSLNLHKHYKETYFKADGSPIKL